jgi:hypothetical protein
VGGGLRELCSFSLWFGNRYIRSSFARVMDQRPTDEYRIETREDLCVVLTRVIESLTQQIDAQDAETADD